MHNLLLPLSKLMVSFYPTDDSGRADYILSIGKLNSDLTQSPPSNTGGSSLQPNFRRSRLSAARPRHVWPTGYQTDPVLQA